MLLQHHRGEATTGFLLRGVGILGHGDVASRKFQCSTRPRAIAATVLPPGRSLPQTRDCTTGRTQPQRNSRGFSGSAVQRRQRFSSAAAPILAHQIAAGGRWHQPVSFFLRHPGPSTRPLAPGMDGYSDGRAPSGQSSSGRSPASSAVAGLPRPTAQAATAATRAPNPPTHWIM